MQNRLLEGHGEALFDLGQEDNGESMQFSREQWDVALDRIRRASSFLRAECRILLTRNIGGPEEAEVKNEKEKGCTAKLLLRQEPETVEDVIETRIAVVGNGRGPVRYNDGPWLTGGVQWMLEKVRCWAFWSKEVWMMGVAKLE